MTAAIRRLAHMGPKLVCIVGAGPAGLVAAKTLLRDFTSGAYEVVVFEKSKDIGGLWPLSAQDTTPGKINPNLRTNLSRHTVTFSDFSWPEETPYFPKASDVGRYLESYVERYKLASFIVTECEVIGTSQGNDATKKWEVVVRKGEKTETHSFHHLIVASGFFGETQGPKLAGHSEFRGQVIHSSKVRHVDSTLLPKEGAGSKIVVVGGSMSGAEIAASIATQLSSDVNSPSTPNVADADKYSVHHVVPRPFWVLPSFSCLDPFQASNADEKTYNHAPRFFPLDLVMYDLTKRPQPLKNTSGYVSPEAAAKGNQHLKNSIGSDQSELCASGNESLAISGDLLHEAPRAAISDNYSEFVRSGNIIPIIGRVNRFQGEDKVVVSSSKGEKIIDDVAAVVFATGYGEANTVHFLPGDILSESLAYQESSGPFPLALEMFSTIHKSANGISDLGFVGMYRGPYWGIMEMQARFLGKLWLGDERAAKALAANPSIIPELRKQWKESPQQIAQFPMGDYVYIMESFAEILDLKPEITSDDYIVIPPRYALKIADKEVREDSLKAMQQLQTAVQESKTTGKFLARAIFRAMQGTWKLERDIISSIASYPSGKLSGTAKFFPREPTEEGYDKEYLYFEEGDFSTETGLRFRANRRYAHRYCESKDLLSVWFVKGDNKTVDYLFHEMKIIMPEDNGDASESNSSGWKATSYHLCIQDHYNVEYEFRFRGVALESWTMAYDVKGPSKDYRISSVFRR